MDIEKYIEELHQQFRFYTITRRLTEQELSETDPEDLADEGGEPYTEAEPGDVADWLRRTLTAVAAEARRDVITEDTIDGYHTFKELYDFRLLYNAHLFNEWYAQGKYNVHKSQRHYDGELCFGRDDYFVVVATLPTGQVSNHYPMSDWDLFRCEAVEKAKAEWDGHTSQDVANRLRDSLTP